MKYSAAHRWIIAFPGTPGNWHFNANYRNRKYTRYEVSFKGSFKEKKKKGKS